MKALRISGTALLLAGLFLAGCLSTIQPERIGAAKGDFAPQNFKVSDFSQETRKLRIILDSGADREEKAEAHRRLAILYLMPANPDRDPEKAANELGKFLEAAPGRLNRAAAADWVKALNSEARFRKLQNENRKLAVRAELAEKENRQLATEKEELSAIITEQKRTIGRIKQLDLSLEQKKRTLLR
ncbi:MAG: hypothetical protein R6W72_02270 [Desulfurivibrionaceae bacterium]